MGCMLNASVKMFPLQFRASKMARVLNNAELNISLLECSKKETVSFYTSFAYYVETLENEVRLSVQSFKENPLDHDA